MTTRTLPWLGKPFHSKLDGTTYTAKAARETMSTLFRFTTGHAVTGEYAIRFLRNRLLPEQVIARHYGAHPQTIEHILLDLE